MKWINRWVWLLALLLTTPAVAQEQVDRARQLIEQGVLVVDVRTTKEYAQAHLDDAIHIPYQRILAQFQRLELRKDRPVVLYCRSGGRAGVAERELRQHGYSQIINGGGYEDLVGVVKTR